MCIRDSCDDIKRKNKPVILSHHMLMGLKQGQEKMSKSDPESAIFMEDSEADVNVKLKKSYCPPGEVAGNPCLEYVKYVVMPWCGKFSVTRAEDNGGDKDYVEYEEVEKDFVDGKLHPGDVKPALARHINAILQPVRDHFANNPEAKKLLDTIKKYKVTK